MIHARDTSWSATHEIVWSVNVTSLLSIERGGDGYPDQKSLIFCFWKERNEVAAQKENPEACLLA